MKNELISQVFVPNRKTWINLFSRCKNTWVRTPTKFTYRAISDEYIVQLDGQPDFDSCVQQWRFKPTKKGLSEAKAFMNELKYVQIE